MSPPKEEGTRPGREAAATLGSPRRAAPEGSFFQKGGRLAHGKLPSQASWQATSGGTSYHGCTRPFLLLGSSLSGIGHFLSTLMTMLCSPFVGFSIPREWLRRLVTLNKSKQKKQRRKKSDPVESQKVVPILFGPSLTKSYRSSCVGILVVAKLPTLIASHKK